MTVRPRQVFSLVIVVAATLAMTGCLPVWTGNHAGKQVAVFGDSIATDTYAGQEIDAALQVDYQTQRFSHPGWRFDQLLPSADALLAKKQFPARVVVELGTNDSIQIAQSTWTLPQTQVAFDRWVATFPAAACLVFVTVNAQRFVATINAASASINAMIRAATDPRIVIADWNKVVADYYKAKQPNGEITVDGTHPTQVGQSMIATLIKTTLDTCPA